MINIRNLEPLGVFDLKGRPVVSSRKVAEIFMKEHKSVLRTIDQAGCSEEFRQRNFVPSSYRNEQNKMQPEFLLTKNGFAFVAMGFTGKRAAQFKEAYINRFEQMEQYIKSLQTAKQEFPYLTEAIKQIHENPKRYHFSNECNLINRVVLGMDAKKFKETNGLGKAKSIRPHLTPEQIEAIEKLQRADIGLVISEPDYQKRKMMLEWYYDKINTSKKLIG